MQINAFCHSRPQQSEAGTYSDPARVIRSPRQGTLNENDSPTRRCHFSLPRGAMGVLFGRRRGSRRSCRLSAASSPNPKPEPAVALVTAPPRSKPGRSSAPGPGSCAATFASGRLLLFSRDAARSVSLLRDLVILLFPCLVCFLVKELRQFCSQAPGLTTAAIASYRRTFPGPLRGTIRSTPANPYYFLGALRSAP